MATQFSERVLRRSYLLGLIWSAYIIVFLIILYKSYQFYLDLESRPEFHNNSNIVALKNLYATAFFLQTFAIVFSCVLFFF